MSGAESSVGGRTGRLWEAAGCNGEGTSSGATETRDGIPVLALNNLPILVSFLIPLNSVSLISRDRYSCVTWLL